MQTVRETARECVNSALEDVKATNDKAVSTYQENASKVNKQAEKYMKSATETNEQMKKWGEEFSKKVSIAMLMTFVSMLVLLASILLMSGLVKPIAQLNKATNDINRIESNAEIVNGQMKEYYNVATGEALETATFTYNWNHAEGFLDYVGVVFKYGLLANWKNVLIIILIASWVIHFIRNKDRY